MNIDAQSRVYALPLGQQEIREHATCRTQNSIPDQCCVEHNDAMKTGLQGVSSPIILIAHRGASHSDNENTKQMFLWKYKIRDHAPPCIVFLLRFSVSDGCKRWLIRISDQNPFEYAIRIFRVHCPFISRMQHYQTFV